MSRLRGRTPTELGLQIQERVREVGIAADADFELAHALEDRLYEDALRKIAGGCSDPEWLAREVLKTKKFNIKRSYS